MKKLVLLCSIIMCYFSSYATITLTASPSTITAPAPGGTAYVSVTVTASGETNAAHIGSASYATHGVTSTPTPNAVDGMTPISPAYYSVATGAVTRFTLNVTSNSCFTTTNTATYYISVSIVDAAGNPVTGSPTFLTFNLTINPPTVYWNSAQSGSFTRNNCGTGYTGSTVNYTVPAHTYSSCNSLADANAAATNDVNTNGQNYVNSNGTCTACTAPVITSATIDGNPITSTATISVGPHVLRVYYTSSTSVTGQFGNTSQGASISSYTISPSPAVCNFYASFVDSPPAPIYVKLTNSCGTTTKTYSFYKQ